VNRALSVTFSPASNDLVAGLEPVGEAKNKAYMKMWNIDTNRERAIFKPEHSAKVSAVAYCTGGQQVATGSHDQR